MRSIVAVAVVLALAVGSSTSSRAAPPPGPGQVELKLVPLQSAGGVVTRADLRQDARIFNNIVLPAAGLQFAQKQLEQPLKLDGGKVSVLMKGSEFILKTPTQEFPIPRQEMSFASITLPNAVVAFPYGYQFRNGGMLWPRSGAVMQAIVDGQTLMLFDDDLDGKYTLAADTLRLGSPEKVVNVFAPASRYIAAGSRIYELKSIADDGSSVQLAAVDQKTGKLSVACTSPGLELHVVLGSAKAGVNCIVKATDSTPAEVALLPGQYELLYGAVYSTRLNALVAILKPGSMKPVEVAPGTTAKLELGIPLRLELQAAVVGKKLNIDPAQFHILGISGEEYRSVEWDREVPPQVYAIRGQTRVTLGKIEFG